MIVIQFQRLASICVTATGAIVAGALLLLAIGCTRGASPAVERRAGSEVSQVLSGNVLVQDVATTLNTLPDYVDTQLRPPTVVLDATTSTDGKTVMGVVTQDPQKPTGRNDYLYVTSRNSRFRRLEVQPGDRVRYFALRDEWGKQHSVELVVQEVLGDYALRLAGGLTEPVLHPERLEVWRYADERIIDIVTRLRQYTDRKPVVGWEPSPDEAALEQVIDRLNQWARQRTPEGDWSLDPLVKTLPEPLQKYADERELAETRFSPYEARLMQEAIWLRDISNWARGDALSDVGIAENLFDWTVRNIQLVTREQLQGRFHRPWQTLMYGRGTAEERAWVFLLLLRQQGLDAALLAIADPEKPDELESWAVAVLSEGKLYLFDPQLGLPIPGPEGDSVATLTQLRENPQLLRQLDLSEEQRYPIEAEDLEHLVALVEGSPLALSSRARMLEKELSGDQAVVLTSQPSAIAEAIRRSGAIDEVRLWNLPYRTRDEQLTRERPAQQVAALEFQVFAWRPQLWKGRVLHFQGEFDGERSAKHYYRQVRPSDKEIANSPRHDIEKNFIRQAKHHASYWLGLLTFDTGEYEVAVDFLRNRTLQATPDGPWTRGARYNLARAYEALGKTKQAIALYETSDESPQSHGNRLRARRLREQASQAQAD